MFFIKSSSVFSAVPWTWTRELILLDRESPSGLTPVGLMGIHDLRRPRCWMGLSLRACFDLFWNPSTEIKRPSTTGLDQTPRSTTKACVIPLPHETCRLSFYDQAFVMRDAANAWSLFLNLPPLANGREASHTRSHSADFGSDRRCGSASRLLGQTTAAVCKCVRRRTRQSPDHSAGE